MLRNSRVEKSSFIEFELNLWTKTCSQNAILLMKLKLCTKCIWQRCAFRYHNVLIIDFSMIFSMNFGESLIVLWAALIFLIFRIFKLFFWAKNGENFKGFYLEILQGICFIWIRQTAHSTQYEIASYKSSVSIFTFVYYTDTPNENFSDH